MARVYLAAQRGPFGATKLVVIKHVRPEVATDRQFIAMFEDEARIALLVSHPNVIHTYEVVAEGADYYLAMEYVDGRSLSEVLARIGRKAVPLEVHIWILTQVLAGLHYAHQLQDFDGTPLEIVHRDVSPSNVLVTFRGEVKLLDFGIAKAVGAISTTRKGVIKGKLGYAAPEQCVGGPVDARADVYAVGVMLWEAMAGRRRAMGETELARIQARLTDQEPAIESVWPEAPPALVAICHRALAREPDLRYASANEFQQALERYLAGTGTQSGPASLSRFLLKYLNNDRQAQQRLLEDRLGSFARSGTTPTKPQPLPQTALDAEGSGADITVVQNGRSRMRFVVAGLVFAALVLTLALLVSRDRAGRPVAMPARVTGPGGPIRTHDLQPAASPPAPRISPLPLAAEGEARAVRPAMAGAPPATGAPVRPKRPRRVKSAVRVEPSLEPPPARREGAERPAAEAAASRPPRRAEPGDDLRLRGTEGTLRNIEEQDVYRQ